MGRQGSKLEKNFSRCCVGVLLVGVGVLLLDVGVSLVILVLGKLVKELVSLLLRLDGKSL